MSFNSSNPNPFPYSHDDTNLFKNVTLIFFLAQIISFLFSMLVSALLSPFILLGANLALAFGVFTISRKYSKLSSGKIVALFLVVEVLYQLIFLFFEQDSFLLFVILQYLVPSMITLITAYLFTKWFNDYLPKPFPKTNAYLIYGILLFIGQVISGYAIYLGGPDLLTLLSTVDNPTASQLLPYENSILIIGIAFFFLLGAVVTLIFASYRIYSRANMMYNAAFSVGPQYRRESSPSYESQDSLKPQSTARTSTQSVVIQKPVSDQDQRNFCGTCGKTVSQGSSFCENCGAKIK
ncbi:MAG: zinc ribbon domain-containing protein [Candidatus Hodarchaeales archaeon]|jgi:hypothetical protein